MATIRLIQKADSKENNFTFLRFLAAFAVIISHNFALWGLKEPRIAEYGSLGGLGLYSFFVISGFLITKSWIDNPRLIYFFKNRGLRIFPALIPVTLFTSFIIGPLATSFSIIEYFRNPQTWEYMKNIFLFPIRSNLPGVFVGNPISNVVNGSLWTLPIEFFMYISIALTGLTGLIHKKAFVPVTLFIMLCLDWFVTPKPEYQNMVLLSFLPVYHGLKLAIYFFMGSFFYLYREKIYLDSKLVILSLILFIVSVGTPFVFIMSYFTLPYLFIYFVFEINNTFFKNFGKYGDFSYGLYIYSFPIQQTLIYFFKGKMNFIIFSFAGSIIILVFAILSWHLIEKYALKFKRARKLTI